MDGQTHGQHENSIPTTNKVCGGYFWPKGHNLNKLGKGPLNNAL